MKYFDSHCQLQFEQYDADRVEVLARMEERGVGGVVVGTDYEMSVKAVELAGRHDFLWATVGSHPNHEEVFDVGKFADLARDPKVVAVGECGLDYYRSDKGNQVEKFKIQLDLARTLGKPVIIHCRDAHEDMLELLGSYLYELENKLVMHFFTGPAELARRYLDLGCYLSFPGPVTFTDMYDESIRICPMDKLLVETDAPFAAPAPYRGARNEPAYVVEVVKKVAQVKGLTEEEVAVQTLQNAQKFFSLD